MKLKEVLDRTVQFFKDKKIETPRLDTEILLTEALGFKNRVDLYLKFEQPLKDEELNKSRDFVRRRVQGEPVAYIIGKKEFFGHTFQVNETVLIPRPETEILVETVIHWLQKNAFEKPRILDLGTGSGCIGLSLLKKFPEATLVAVDKSIEAVETARANAENLKIAERAEWIVSDVLNLNFDSRSFDVIVANPPYIAEDDSQVQLEVKMFEPHEALFSEDDGFFALKKWSEKSVSWLKPRSLLGFEMGAGQGPVLKEHFTSLKIFDTVKVIKDLAGFDRHIIGEKNG